MTRDEYAGDKGRFDSNVANSGERRQATVLFADLVGFTAFSERRGEEACGVQNDCPLVSRLINVSGAGWTAATTYQPHAGRRMLRRAVMVVERAEPLAVGGPSVGFRSASFDWLSSDFGGS